MEKVKFSDEDFKRYEISREEFRKKMIASKGVIIRNIMSSVKLDTQSIVDSERLREELLRSRSFSSQKIKRKRISPDYLFYKTF